MTRVLVVGARCRRQGIGEFVSRYFAEAGAEVCAIVGTSAATVAEARRTLLERYGIDCRGYTSLVRALESVRPGIAVICSPYAVHREQLEVVAAAGAHCLCEKPLWWGEATDRCAETARLVDLFAARGLYLAQVAQWPWTLPAFHELYPPATGRTVERFEMQLSPISKGVAMVLDAAPHVLSMLQELTGHGEIESPRAIFSDDEKTDLRLEFHYRHGQGTTVVSCRFQRCERPPRPAGYAVNGMEVSRRIDMPAYDIYFEAGGRSVKLEDPLKLLVADFVDKSASGASADQGSLVASIGLLESLTDVAEAAEVPEVSNRATEN